MKQQLFPEKSPCDFRDAIPAILRIAGGKPKAQKSCVAEFDPPPSFVKVIVFLGGYGYTARNTLLLKLKSGFKTGWVV